LSIQASGLRQNKNWQRLWLGQSVSLLGDMVFLITVLLWIATVIAKGPDGVIASWAPAAVSGALIAVAVPALIVGPFAGVWVDRWNRRRTMLAADAARFLLIAGLLVLPLLRHRIPVGGQLAILYAVLAAASCFAEFFDPSRLAVIGTIVPPDDQARASGHLQAMAAFAQVLGPPIAAPLLITFGVQWALILNAASFGISFLCVRAIRIPPAPPQPGAERASYGAELREGLKYFAASKILVSMAISIMITMLGVGAINAVGVFFIVHNLHVSASWLGTVSGVVGAGAVAGALATGALASRIQLGKLLWAGLIAGGLGLVGLSRCTALPPALVAGLELGLSVGVINAVDGPILLRTTPLHLMGRVSAVFSPLQQIAALTSMTLAGVLSSTVLLRFHAVIAGVTFGPYDTIFGIAGLMFVVAGLAIIRPMRALPAAAVPGSAGISEATAPGDAPEAAPAS